jgi:hypothetical protein
MAVDILWSNFDEATKKQLNLATLAADEKGHLNGGSGGVDVLVADGKRYTIKTSSSADALKDEVFADAGYALLGFNVPKFSVHEVPYDQLPEPIKKCLANQGVAIPKDTSEKVFFSNSRIY